LVEIEYRPYQKIVVHEVRKVEVAEFFRSIVAQVEAQKQSGTPVVNWVDGVAFSIVPFVPTPELVEENLKGVVHYAVVLYTETSFQEEKRAIINGREFPVKLHRASDNENFVDLVRFLKTFKPTSTAS
jgi:hypothetical protein